ncbi:MAG: hypothetical protein FWF54_03425 [Candidatus Azobacteroides sp.]|nr:hypothetical protein [Candidatus Azobacteroides sp.]
MKKFYIVLIIIVVVLLFGGLAYYFIRQQRMLSEMSEQFDLQKEELETEYSQLAAQYDDYRLPDNIKNDSLLYLLDSEKAKVQRLLEELRTVKATNAKRINELKKELETVRTVMKSYVAQIDSLNTLNQQLQKKNEEVTQKYQQASQTVSRLSQEKEHLTERVNLASKLNATDISVTPVNKKGKKEKKINKIQQLNICFSIAKNVTAPTGEKTLYVRIMKPDDDILVKNRNNVFIFENKEINYSIKKVIEYDGEDSSACVYWAVEEFLYPGNYRADIFADGNLIGSQSFMLEK